jgi:hypothetical protein
MKQRPSHSEGRSRPTAPFQVESNGFGKGAKMAEKVKKLDLKRDYKTYLYFIDGGGNVCQKPKTGDGESEILVKNAVDRDNQFLYFIDKDGDVARSPRGGKRKAA